MRQAVSSNLQAGVTLLSVRLSLDPSLVRQRCLIDPAFRALCEDYHLACQSLLRLEQLNKHDPRPEVIEYAALIAELEAEATRVLDQGRAGGA